MKLLLILILLIFIVLYTYHTKIDTFSGETTSSGNTETTSIGNTDAHEDTTTKYNIKINTEIKDKNNIKISWIKPTSLKIHDYYIILDKIEKNINNDSVVVKKQIYPYKNNKEHVIVNYYIGKLDNGYYNIYVIYDTIDDTIDSETVVKKQKSNVTQIVINHIDKSFIPLLDNILVNSNEELYNIQYNKIKGSIYEKNTIKDNYNINIY